MPTAIGLGCVKTLCYCLGSPTFTAEAFQEIIVRLSVLRYVITSNTRRGKFDIATDAEDFFAGFLNRLLGWELVSLNNGNKIHPAIELGDKKYGFRADYDKRSQVSA